jgi:hypothetical protein
MPRISLGALLAELIISAWILGLLIVFMFTIYPAASLAVRGVEHRLEASDAAQSILEKKRLAPFATIDVPPAQRTFTGRDGTLYKIDYRTFIPSGADAARLRAIRARITWEEKGRERALEHELWVYHIPK